MLLNKNIENISKITENEKSVEVENSEEALDRDRLLKARIMYILKEYPCGLKQKDFLKNYKKFYGEEMSPEKFGLTNMRQVFMQFPEMIHIKMTNSLEITNTYKSSSDYLMFAPIKDITTYLNYLPSDMQVNKSMRVIVEGVYDPSKLWIVPKFKELKQFMDYLRFFYKNKSHMFNIPSNMISMNLLCILYKNNWFFRVLIINVFNNAEVLVFSVDYGKFVKCSIKDLYYMHKKFADIPRFCFRARLANICPINANEFWSTQSAEEFDKMLYRRIMYAKVLFIEEKQKVLHVALREFCGHFCPYLNDLLVEKELAQYLYTRKSDYDATIYTNFKPLVNHLYMFPPFELLERGLAAPSLKIVDISSQTQVLDKLFKNYVRYYSKD